MTRYRLKLESADRYWTGAAWSEDVTQAVCYLSMSEALMSALALARRLRVDYIVEPVTT